jgi:hypothetical protein
VTNPEDRLRQAIAARTNAVEPSPGSLDQIQEKLMDAHRTDRNRSRLLIGLGAAAAVVAIVVAAVLVTQDDDDSNLDVADQTSTTADGSTSSTSATTSTTVAPAPRPDESQTIYPTAVSDVRYDDPEKAARDFAVDIVGMPDDLEVSAFQQGDSRSGEVTVARRAGLAETTILMRQLEDDYWYVIGAVTENITLTSPEHGDTVTSPIRLQGESIAFEAQVNVLVFADVRFGERAVVGEGFVMGGGSEVLPFDGEVAYDLGDTGAEWGTVVMLTYSAEDGSITELTATRVRFG